MNLTINDVRRKQFDKVFRGYDPTEVDLFLKQVADQLEAVQDDARRADDRVREMESKLAHYEKVELALQEALESARETARRSEATAEEKARLMIQEAELRAERILHDAERERHGLRQDLVRLNSRQAEVAARLRGFLLSELEVLAQFQGDDPVGFIKLQPANPQGQIAAPPARLEAPTPDPIDDYPDAAHEEQAAYDEVPAPEPAPAPVPETPAAQEPPPEPMPERASAPQEAPVNEPHAAPEAWAEATEEPPAPPPLDPFRSPSEVAAEPPRPPGGTVPGAYDAADESPAPSSDPVDATPPAAVTGGWDLRSLVTGSEKASDPNVAGSEEERDRIRRILDDLE